MSDPRIEEFRARISAEDRAILDAVNHRLDLVRELKRYKEEQGIAFVDPDRERAILDELERANRGPLSPEGLRRLFGEVLALTKNELRAGGEAAG